MDMPRPRACRRHGMAGCITPSTCRRRKRPTRRANGESRISRSERRCVIYNGYAEATRVPPSWHGWMHHTVDVPPTEEAYTPREWEKPHLPNLTGAPLGY